MQRELLLVAEMIRAAERLHDLVKDLDLAGLEADALRQEALLWNFTVLGEAATQLGCAGAIPADSVGPTCPPA
jgi:uncharacterized protein with HEPN domain